MSEEESSKPLSFQEQLDLRRFDLDQKRLQLERQRAKREARLIVTHFPALVSAAIAFAGLVLSGANIWVAYITKSKDTDIATRKDLRDFVAEYRATIFGDDRAAAEQIRNVMRVTFPDDLLEVVLPQIVANAPSTTRDLFSTNLADSRRLTGRVGTWGGPADKSLAPGEQLALINPSELSQFSEYFLPEQPAGTTGLARRLNPESHYISARWNFSDTSRTYLKTHKVTVTNPKTGKSAQAQPVDWGPPAVTGRIADISPGLAKFLALSIDDVAIVEIPAARRAE